MNQPQFLTKTMDRTHPVLHNNDLMKIIGTIVCDTIPNRRAFIATCRHWRQIYYSSVTIVSLYHHDELLRYLMNKLYGNAFSLTYRNLSVFGLTELNSALGCMPNRMDVVNFLRPIRKSSECHNLNIFWRALTDKYESFTTEFNNLCNRKMNQVQFPLTIRKIILSLMHVDSAPADIISYLCGKLNQNHLNDIYEAVLRTPSLRIHLPILFKYIIINIEHFTKYMTAYRNPAPTNVSAIVNWHPIDPSIYISFEDMCRSFLRDNHVDRYVSLLNNRQFPFSIESCWDTFLRVGAGADGFVTDLFMEEPYDNSYDIIKRFLMLNLTNPCNTIRYKFYADDIRSRMTIFEYVNYYKHLDLCDSIVADSRFKVEEHMSVMAFGIINGKKRIAFQFIKCSGMNKEELELALKVMREAKEISRAQDKPSFDEVIRKLENKIAEEEGSRKRIKLQEDVEVVAENDLDGEQLTSFEPEKPIEKNDAGKRVKFADGVNEEGPEKRIKLTIKLGDVVIRRSI